MSSIQPTAELIPSQEPERELPELRLIQGGGEDPAREDDVRPDLYAPEPEDTETDDTVVDIQARRLSAAGRSGRQAVSDTRIAVAGESTVSASAYYEEDSHKYRGGGGWLIREYMRQQAAKAKAEADDHENNCVCQVCRNL